MCAWQLDILLFLRRYLQHGGFQSSDKKAGHHCKEMRQESSQVSLDLQLSVEESQLFRGAASCTPSQHVETLLQVSSMMWQAARSTRGVGSNSLIQAVPRCSGDLQEYSIVFGSECSHSFCTLLTLQISTGSLQKQACLFSHSKNAGYNPVITEQIPLDAPDRASVVVLFCAANMCIRFWWTSRPDTMPHVQRAPGTRGFCAVSSAATIWGAHDKFFPTTQVVKNPSTLPPLPWTNIISCSEPQLETKCAVEVYHQA